MYSITAYYFAALTMAFVLVWFYPVFVSIVTFYWLQLPADTAWSFFNYTAILGVTCLGGSYFGFMLGCFIRNEMAATETCSLFITLFNLGAGCFANAGANANIAVKLLTHVSPMRYSAELAMRRITEGREVQK